MADRNPTIPFTDRWPIEIQGDGFKVVGWSESSDPFYTIDRWPIGFTNPFCLRSLTDRNPSLLFSIVVVRSFWTIRFLRSLAHQINNPFFTVVCRLELNQPLYDHWPMVFNDYFLAIVGRSFSTGLLSRSVADGFQGSDVHEDHWPIVVDRSLVINADRLWRSQPFYDHCRPMGFDEICLRLMAGRFYRGFFDRWLIVCGNPRFTMVEFQ